MAHYALIDSDNIVIKVITGFDETNTDDLPEGFDTWEDYYLNKYSEATLVKRTSYNTLANEHKNGGTAFRGNYAGKGYTYDTENDVFIPANPSNDEETFELNTTTWNWDLV